MSTAPTARTVAERGPASINASSPTLAPTPRGAEVGASTRRPPAAAADHASAHSPMAVEGVMG